jgi:hypothetical protein
MLVHGDLNQVRRRKAGTFERIHVFKAGRADSGTRYTIVSSCILT